MDFGAEKAPAKEYYVAYLMVAEKEVLEFKAAQERGIKIHGILIDYHPLGTGMEEEKQVVMEISFDDLMGLITEKKRIVDVTD